MRLSGLALATIRRTSGASPSGSPAVRIISVACPL